MFIDTHAHIYLEKFHDDFEDLITRAEKARVRKILMPNIDNNTLAYVFKISNEYPDKCLPMVGLHPCSVDENWQQDLNLMEPYINMDEVIAIGETGIDLYWDKTFAKEQENSFRQQIQWALELDLPVVIHSRSAIKNTIEIITDMQNGSLKGVFHCFDQGYEEAKKIVDLGFYMGIGGVSTYKKNQDLRDTIRKIPIEYILLETDAPYLPPTPHRGKRNEPSYIPIIAELIASLKGLSVREIADHTATNAQHLFKLS